MGGKGEANGGYTNSLDLKKDLESVELLIGHPYLNKGLENNWITKGFSYYERLQSHKSGTMGGVSRWRGTVWLWTLWEVTVESDILSMTK